MSNCNHEFQGDKDGVRCLKCQKRLSHTDFIKYLKAPSEKPKDEKKKSKVD